MEGMIFVGLVVLFIGIWTMISWWMEKEDKKPEPVEEYKPYNPPDFIPEAPEGTFRITTIGMKIVVQRYKRMTHSEYGVLDWSRGAPTHFWETQYDDIGILAGKTRVYWEFDHEIDAENKIMSVLAEEKRKIQARVEEQKRKEEFARLHPTREIPPYKYVS